MKVILLGTGTSTGVPVIGCHCAVCESADPRDKRTRSSIAIAPSAGRWIVFDTTPEFRLQAIAAGIDELSDVVYTHVHADHCHGFDDLRAYYFHRQAPIRVHLSPEYVAEFKSRFAYAFSDTGYAGAKPQIEIRTIPTHEFEVGGLDMEPLRLPHGHVETCAFRIGRFAYATDFKSFSRAQVAAWKGKIDVMVASGIHFGTHKTHSVIPETIELFDQLEVKHGILTHLTHDVCHARDALKLPPGVELGYDGMTIDV